MNKVLSLKAKLPQKKVEDAIAEIVVERFNRAKQYRNSYIVHQGVSYSSLIDRADHQYRREYTCADATSMTEAFGFTPSRYYGVTQQKVNATVAWSNDLVLNNLDTLFTATPSPEPTLDKDSQNRIRNGVKRELVAKMHSAGLSDPQLLLDIKGKPAVQVEDFLFEQMRALKKVEQTRLMGLAADQANAMQRRMRDMTIEGGWRQAYAAYTMERYLYGVGYIRFPDWQRRRRLAHMAGGKADLRWEVVPNFRHVSVKNFYPMPDSDDLQTNTGNTEYGSISKVELINLARTPGFSEQAIKEVLETYSYRPRDWLSDTAITDKAADFWGLDEGIALLRHEGFFSGRELAEYGVTGYDELDYVTARVEIVGNKTIRVQVDKLPAGAERSYFGAPFIKLGTNPYDSIGMAAMLWDTEQRVNRFMHLFENNADWAARAPLLVNSSVFQNPLSAQAIRPGKSYEVEDSYAVSGSMPDPVRPIHTVSAQYHLLMTQVGALLRQADEDCGIPALSYGSQDYGRASLGEYTQRMSNALRTIKQAALHEDIYLIEPIMTGLFHHIMENDAGLRKGQDVNLVIRGMTGLLREDQRAKAQEGLIPSILQLAQGGVVPKEVGDYAVRTLLEQAGFPVDALGMSDPVIENALAVAASQPMAGFVPGGQQVPKLDGRSGAAAQANSASPTGISPSSIPAVGVPSPGGIE